MARYSETGDGLPLMEVPWNELVAARMPPSVNWSGVVGSAVLIQLAWAACGKPGPVPQGDWTHQLVPDGDATRFVAEMVSRV